MRFSYLFQGMASTIIVRALHYAGAASTAVGGILHLILAPNMLGFNLNTGLFFLIGGIAQVFWVVPVVRRWGRPWYAVGIAGTTVLVAVYFVTRVPGNPITGRGGGMNSMAIAVEAAQLAFIGLCIAILAIVEKKKEVVKQ
jgi:hypothetical protein